MPTCFRRKWASVAPQQRPVKRVEEGGEREGNQKGARTAKMRIFCLCQIMGAVNIVHDFDNDLVCKCEQIMEWLKLNENKLLQRSTKNISSGRGKGRIRDQLLYND